MKLDEKESKFVVPGPAGQIEAAWNKAETQNIFDLLGVNPIAVLCHPHPLHGGTMENKVVTTLMRTYRDLGINVVRFNFRGVGNSQGDFDNGVGELDDLMSILQWVDLNAAPSAILLAGFSFGSSIAARASYSAKQLRHLTLVAPPVERYEYDRNGKFDVPLCVVQGEKDERVFAEGVYQWQEGLVSPSLLLRYPEAGHFFHGYLTALKQDLTHVLKQQLLHS